MNIWLITSINMDPLAAPRASSIQNARTAAALAETGHKVLLWHAGTRLSNPSAWFIQNFGVEPPAGMRFLGYSPRGLRFEKKTPFAGLDSKIYNLSRAWWSLRARPDAIITRSPLLLDQLRDGLISAPMLRRARLILEWQYPESIQLWRGWRRANPAATLRERVGTLRELRRKELGRIAHADAILYAARGHKQLLREASYGGPTAPIPSGCLAPAAAPPTEAAEFDFGYAGSLAPENGVELALEALARLGSGTLLLLGSGNDDYVDHLRRRVVDLQITDRVHFAGRVNPAEVRDRLRVCRVGLVPISRRCGREKRQFASPLKLIEWLAAGVPAIAADVPSVAGLIRDEALIVPADDAAALAAAMERLMGDETLRRRLAAAGLALAQTLTYPARASRILKTMQIHHAKTQKVQM